MQIVPSVLLLKKIMEGKKGLINPYTLIEADSRLLLEEDEQREINL